MTRSSEPAEVKVAIPGRAYSVWVGPGLLARAHELIPVPPAAEVAALMTDSHVGALHGNAARGGLEPSGLRVEDFTFEPGEQAKTLACAEAALRWLAATGAHRGDLVVALGGGVVCDLAGFAAAVYARGAAVAHLPTTVLAQVDAAVGGKTGVNLPEGKNLVGAFHQPVAVLADTTTLATLPDAELASGLAEAAKHGLIDDPEILRLLERDGERIRARDDAALRDVIARAVAVKARVVEQDETESGVRAHLNYGHTLGHALEALGGYTRWRHGEAVAVGMMFVAHLAPLLGFADRTGDHRRVLEALGLPTGGAGEDYDAVAALWARDKKYRAGVRLVVLEDLGRPRVMSGVPDDALRRAYEAVR